eukprot:PLAT493.2.p1 GENE.PLAT493.2~~PLAT493.2.p1  ORF type:complete len:230 (+),score=68.54 PLAT493.2:32-691(+)
MASLFGLGRKKTFRPRKKFTPGTKRYDLHKFAKATLGSGDMATAVSLPPDEDLNEWLAVNTVDFFNEISLLYGTVTEFCTDESCPIMSAGSKYEYLWKDETMRSPEAVSAPVYVDKLMEWVDNQLNDPSIFPADMDQPYPRSFVNYVKVIFKRLFRVYAHIYFSHFEHVVGLGAEAHLNTCFKHFIYFVREFNLVASKEQAPLAELIENLTSPGDSSSK